MTSYPGRTATVRIGIAAPLDTIDSVLADVGAVDSQRIYSTSLSDDKSLKVKAAADAGRLPVLSVKVGSWATYATGSSDRATTTYLDKLNALGVPVVVAAHHEPVNDAIGTAAEFAAMQRRFLPMVAARPNLAPAVILNGFPFGPTTPGGGGMTDAEIGAYVPADVLRLVDVVAADFYESDRNMVADLVERFVAWGDRVGVRELAVGEFGTYTAATLETALAAIIAHRDRLGFACYFDSPRNSRADWVLTGDRLATFKAGVATARTVGQAPPPPADPAPTGPAPTDTSSTQLADLEAQVAELEEELATAQGRAADLEEQLAAAQGEADRARAVADAVVAVGAAVSAYQGATT